MASTCTSRHDRTYTVYWIHNSDCHDVMSEGYVGVTSEKSLKRRLGKHDCRHYPRVEISPLLVDLPRDEALSWEKYFRPEKNIGWNKMAGGVISPPRPRKNTS